MKVDGPELLLDLVRRRQGKNWQGDKDVGVATPCIAFGTASHTLSACGTRKGSAIFIYLRTSE